MEKLKGIWADLSAQRKKQIVLGVGCTVLVTILWQFLNGSEYEKRDFVSPSSVQLTGDNTGGLAMDALSARVRSMENANHELERQLREVAEQKARLAKNSDGSEEDANLQSDYQRQIDRLHQRMNRQNRALREKGIKIDDEGNITEGDDDEFAETVTLLDEDTANSEPIDFSQSPSNGGARPGSDTSIWADSSRFQAPPSRQPGEQQVEDSANGVPAKSQNVAITLIESTPDAATLERDKRVEDEEDVGQYLPAGSIVSGTLITGLDAPTSNSAKGNPHPALVRIKTESILPNRYRADLRECFMIVSGYGDMSSERAYLRTETLSCINNKGESMETSLESFAVGEDGKAGVRGRLVTKTGQLLAKSTMAAFISAASDVFGSSPIPTISTSASDAMPFQQALSEDAVQSAAMKGTGKAMERIADYYMDMADQIFPILEVDAGREIDLILNSGVEIKFNR